MGSVKYLGLAIAGFALAGSSVRGNAQLLVDTTGATVITTSSDDGTFGPRNLGFTFSFFGTNRTQTFINNNGNLSFGSGSTAFTNVGFPTGSPPRIAPGWDDLFEPVGKVTEQKHTGVYAASWEGVRTFSNSAARITMQAALFGPGAAAIGGFLPQANDIAFSYGTRTGSNDGSTTVGINAGNSSAFAVAPGGGANGIFNNAQLATLPIFATTHEFILFRPNANRGYDVSVVDASVPEPATAGLLLIGCAATVGFAIRRRRA